MDKTISEQIYEKYNKKIYGYFISKTNHKEISDDLTSEVFIKVFEKLDSFDEKKASISTWIYTIAHNKLIDYYRGIKPVSVLEDDYLAEDDIEEAVCNQETLEMLADALEQLDERDRELIILRYYSGKTLKEIAVIMQISYSYVKMLHNKALKELKKSFM